MPESALAGKGKHIMRCEKLLKNMFIVRDLPTPAWSTAKRPRVSADEGYRSAEGGFFRYAPSEKNIKPNVEVDKYRLIKPCLRTEIKRAPTYLSAAGAPSA